MTTPVWCFCYLILKHWGVHGKNLPIEIIIKIIKRPMYIMYKQPYVNKAGNRSIKTFYEVATILSIKEGRVHFDYYPESRDHQFFVKNQSDYFILSLNPIGLLDDIHYYRKTITDQMEEIKKRNETILEQRKVIGKMRYEIERLTK
jgi:hypothetical protein